MIAKLHFITQETKKYNHLQAVKAACEAGVKWVQLRIKGKSGSEVLEVAKDAKNICEGFGARLIINDYPEIAREVNAYGVHVGKEDMPVSAVRKIVGNNMIIGASANTLKDILHHVNNGADYIGLGPLRYTSTKKKLSPVLGDEGFKKIMTEYVKHRFSIPIIAIGGIEDNDIPMLTEIGIHGVAISSAIINSENINSTVHHIDSLLKTKEYVNHSR